MPTDLHTRILAEIEFQIEHVSKHPALAALRAVVELHAPGHRVVSRLVGPWEPVEQPAPVVHRSPHCGCGINDAGQRYTDPICREA